MIRRPVHPKFHSMVRQGNSIRGKNWKINRVDRPKNNVQVGAFSAIFHFISQTVLIAALLYYFGWVRTQANFGYFGVDTSLLSFGTADYVLRSINSAFPPLTGFALVAILLLALHRWVAREITARRRSATEKALTTFVSTAPLVGLALATVALIGIIFPATIGHPLGYALPLLLISAVALLGYPRYLQSLRSTARGSTHTDPDSAQTRTRAVVLAALGALGVLWWLALYADQVGEREAVDSVATLQDQPEVIIYSTDRIALAGPGVIVGDVQQTGSKYRYQYSGLRLLVQTGTQYILVPAEWQKGRDKVFLVPINDSVRLDMISR